MRKEPKTTIFRVIDKYTARMLANVLMGCYRRGVLDARDHCDDEGMLREFMASVRNGERYGFVDFSAKNPLVWRNRLGEVAEECNYVGAWHTYVDRMGRPWGNYLSVMLVLGQEMYCRGMEDWLEDPADDLTRFTEGSVRTLWTAKGPKEIDKYRIRTIVQDYCALRSERMEEEEINDPMKKSHYDIFGSAFAYAVVAK